MGREGTTAGCWAALMLVVVGTTTRAQEVRNPPVVSESETGSETGSETVPETSSETVPESERDATQDTDEGLSPPPLGSTRTRVVPPAPYGTSPPTTDVTTRGPDHNDDTWGLYHQAAIALADEEERLAVELLHQVCREDPAHPAAIEARRLLRRLGARSGEPTRSGERRSPLARAELAATQTFHGAAFSTFLCVAAECDSVRTWTVATLFGGAAGLGLSLGLSRRGISPGQAQLYDTLPRWGWYNGWLLFTALGANFDEDFGFLDGNIGMMMASLAIGHAISLGAGILVDYTASPTAGDVAIMDTFMIVASAITVQFHALGGAYDDVSSSEGKLRGLMGGLLVVNVAALGFSGWLTSKVEFSRGRALLIDLGAGAGFGLGVGIVALIQGDDLDREPAFIAGLLGTGAGFALSYWLSRNLRPRDLPVDLSVSPVRGGAVGQLRATF